MPGSSDGRRRDLVVFSEQQEGWKKDLDHVKQAQLGHAHEANY